MSGVRASRCPRPRPPAPPLELTDALVDEVRDAVAAGNADLIAALTGPLHAADLADLLERLTGEERFAVIGALGPGFDAETLAYLDEFVRDQVIEALGPRPPARCWPSSRPTTRSRSWPISTRPSRPRSWRPCRCPSARRSSRAWRSRSGAPAG